MDAKDRKVPDNRRGLFKEPLGKDLSEDGLSDIKGTIITVGDVVSLTAMRKGILPDIAIYDGMTERHEMTDFAALVKSKGMKETVVRNPAGTISAELVTAIRNALAGNKEIIRVEGEEDLATIPCILLSPDGTNIIYGWPGKGMKIIVNSGVFKKRAQELVELMEETG